MQFDMEPIGLPSPSRTYQAVQKCCHGTWWLFGMVAIGVALRIADCPLYNFCCLVETIAPKKLTWVPVFKKKYIYITCMPINYTCTVCHSKPFWFILVSSTRHFSVLSLGSAALSNSCRIKTWSLHACKAGWWHLPTYMYLYIYTNEIQNILHTYLRISIHRFLNVYIYIYKYCIYMYCTI